MGNANVVLTFVWFTNELKDNTDKTVHRNLFKDYKREMRVGN